MTIKNTKLTRALFVLLFKIARARHLRSLHKPSGVVFISSKLCIKSTPFTRMAEAEAMRHVSKLTSIPVPKVYLAFEHKQHVYVVMERVHGQPLSAGWSRRTPGSKAAIFEQLRLFINDLRNIETAGSICVSDVCGGPIYDPRLPGNGEWGPFPSIRDFHRRLRNGIAFDDIQNPESIPQDLKNLFLFHERPWGKPVFTHGDLSSLNILAQGDKVTAIVDWETAGWMPAYWEYTSARNANPQNQFWREEVDNFLTPDPQAWESELTRQKYFGDF